MDLLTFLDFLGISVFAMSGALIAARRETDIIGFILLGTVTGIGGGTIRDLLLDLSPVFWVREPVYLQICMLTSILTYFIAHYISTYRRVLVWADAMGLAVFTVVGTQIALNAGSSAEVAILMGMMTATFGGIIRDVLSGNESLILKKEIYVTATFIGACTYVLLIEFYVPEVIATWGVISLTFAIRAVAIIYDLRLPGYKWINNEEK